MLMDEEFHKLQFNQKTVSFINRLNKAKRFAKQLLWLSDVINALACIMAISCEQELNGYQQRKKKKLQMVEYFSVGAQEVPKTGNLLAKKNSSPTFLNHNPSPLCSALLLPSESSKKCIDVLTFASLSIHFSMQC